MNSQFKTVLLTILTLSILTVALIELTGISKTALFNKYQIGSDIQHHHDFADQKEISEEESEQLPRTVISFDDKHHDFGKIEEGEKVRHIYKFKNTGENPLLIKEAIPTCGCTIPSFSKHPIPPGGEGEIEIEFNSSNRKGSNHKSIIIVSNAEEERIPLSFSADVE